MLKILTIASMSLAIATGAALAQTSPSPSSADAASNPSAQNGSLTGTLSEEDNRMMETWRGREGFASAFFTDDTMMTMRSEEEMKTNWAAMSADDQAAIKADCEMLETNRGVHGEVTLGFCAAINAI